jgi:hypothetical protein
VVLRAPRSTEVSLAPAALAARAAEPSCGPGRPTSPEGLAFQSLRSLQRHCVPCGPAASRQTAFRPHVFGRAFGRSLQLWPSPAVLGVAQNARSLSARGIERRFAAKRRGGASPPKTSRALGRPLSSARSIPLANVAPNIALRYWSRRRYRFCVVYCPCSLRPVLAPPGPRARRSGSQAGRLRPTAGGPQMHLLRSDSAACQPQV